MDMLTLLHQGVLFAHLITSCAGTSSACCSRPDCSEFASDHKELR